MKVVYKYPLSAGTPSVVEMPVGAVILHVGQQNDGPVLWALVDNGQSTENREFFVYGTGHPITESDLSYVGSCQVPTSNWPGGELVWHVFERR